MIEMDATKTTTLTLRIDPAIRKRLRLTAEQEYRSLNNMLNFWLGNTGSSINR